METRIAPRFRCCLRLTATEISRVHPLLHHRVHGDVHRDHVGRRAWIEVSERFIGPDVNGLKTEHDRARSGGVAVAAGPSSEPLVIHESKVHLVEIDLLRAGRHTTAVPENRLASANHPFDYHVRVYHLDNLVDVGWVKADHRHRALPRRSINHQY